MKSTKSIFEFGAKPGKVILFSFLITFLALFLTYSTVSVLTKKGSDKIYQATEITQEDSQKQ